MNLIILKLLGKEKKITKINNFSVIIVKNSVIE